MNRSMNRSTPIAIAIAPAPGRGTARPGVGDPPMPSRRAALTAFGLAAVVPGCLDGPPSDLAQTPPPITAVRSNTLLALSSLTTVSFGGYLNGESFQQDGIVTYNGYQYAAYWNAEARVVLARRPGGEGDWTKIEMAPGYTGSSGDAHNTISLGISPRDGRLHVAFDHHDSDLRHVQSVAGLVSRPDTALWDTASFGPVTSQLGTQAVADRITYPRFATTPDGRMLLSYRHGATGDGDEMLWLYDGTSGSWTALGPWIAGRGDGLNAYLHGLEYHGRRLHAAWCWRNSADASTNHDLMYAWSDDDGRNWRNSRGEPVGTAGTAPMDQRSATRVWPIARNRGLINQEHMTVDNAGRVHVLLSHLPDSEPDDADFLRARARCRFFHYWRSLDGTWTRVPMNIAVTGTWRGKLAVSSADNLYAVLPGVRMASASAPARWSNWTLIDTELEGRYFSDPLIDRQRLRGSDRLTVFAATVNGGGVVRIDTLGYTLY
jgi:hypothetical protein